MDESSEKNQVEKIDEQVEVIEPFNQVPLELEESHTYGDIKQAVLFIFFKFFHHCHLIAFLLIWLNYYCTIEK